LALAYKHPVEFSKNNHTPTTTPQQGHNRGNSPTLPVGIYLVKSEIQRDSVDTAVHTAATRAG
jgi:hypothetical protein